MYPWGHRDQRRRHDRNAKLSNAFTRAGSCDRRADVGNVDRPDSPGGPQFVPAQVRQHCVEGRRLSPDARADRFSAGSRPPRRAAWIVTTAREYPKARLSLAV
jgi:hypothetical protein